MSRLVDAIQALGRLVIDVQDMHIDYLVAGSNKGLLGTLGAGLVYCSDRIVQDIIPPYASYQSVVSHVAPPAITTNFESLEWYPHARRFESGNLSYNCILAISKGIDVLLELGVGNIEKHIRKLERQLRDSIADITLPVVQAKDPKNWSGIVCVYYPPHADDEMIAILKKHRIHATIRAGYMRFGINFYNTESEMDRVSIALHEIAAQAKRR
jgi:selenocysteine lyase/cysteine desulfurase